MKISLIDALFAMIHKLSNTHTQNPWMKNSFWKDELNDWVTNQYLVSLGQKVGQRYVKIQCSWTTCALTCFVLCVREGNLCLIGQTTSHNYNENKEMTALKPCVPPPIEHDTVMFTWQLDIQIHPSRGKKGVGACRGRGVKCYSFKSQCF